MSDGAETAAQINAEAALKAKFDQIIADRRKSIGWRAAYVDKQTALEKEVRKVVFLLDEMAQTHGGDYRLKIASRFAAKAFQACIEFTNETPFPLSQLDYHPLERAEAEEAEAKFMLRVVSECERRETIAAERTAAALARNEEIAA